mgnify:CR=1 FL=1
MADKTEVELRIDAMADEFREIIASISQHCVELAVANALANKTISEQQSEINELKTELKDGS